MSDVIDWEEWKKRKPEFMRRFFESEPRRLPRRRPRDPERERVLIELDLERRRRWIESGKLVELGPRHWRLNITYRKKED